MSAEVADFLLRLWELIQAAGAVLCVAFGWLWRQERNERVSTLKLLLEAGEKHRAEKDAITERATVAINAVTTLVQSIKDLLVSGKVHG